MPKRSLSHESKAIPDSVFITNIPHLVGIPAVFPFIMLASACLGKTQAYLSVCRARDEKARKTDALPTSFTNLATDHYHSSSMSLHIVGNHASFGISTNSKEVDEFIMMAKDR